MKMRNSKYKGIILIIFSAFSFALMMTFVRLAGDIPSPQKAFFRNAVAAVFAFAVLLGNREMFTVPKGSMKFLILRSVAGTLGILCNFYAIDRLVLADVSILNKMSPFFTVVFSIFLLKERIKPFQLITILTAFVGSMLVVKPTIANAQLFPSVIGLLGGIAAGAAYTFVRKASANGVKGPFIVFFFSSFSTLVLLPFLITNYTPMSTKQLIFLLLAGMAAAGGQFTITAAYSYAPAKEISVFDYSQIIFSSLIGFFVFGQIPDLMSFIGYAVIIAAAVMMFVYNNRKLKYE